MSGNSNGISFIVRAHNEERHLERCITSLDRLTIPFEVNVLLHRCTDNSRQIVERLAATRSNVFIYEYDKEVSRAGYETLVTPALHPNSFISYAAYAFSTGHYKWKFRWDADFAASDGLIDFLNTFDIDTDQDVCYRIPCLLGESGIMNAELYLSNCLQGVTKQLFWEVYVFAHNNTEIVLNEECLIESITNENVKPYWLNRTPWFVNDQELFDKYQRLVDVIGPEPAGLARASNHECDPYFHKLYSNEQLLASYGIQFTA